MACRGGISSRTQRLANWYFLPLINFEPGDLVVDCGANVGELKLYFKESGLPVEYIGIEPSPLEFECLKENVAPSEALNIGLWNCDGELDFFVSSELADSSFIEPRIYEKLIKVQTKRLDSLLANRKIKLLKLEAEGAEPEVLVGCSKILDRIEYISADVGFERGVDRTSTLAAVTNHLLANGFELVEVQPKQRLTALFRNAAYGPRDFSPA